jgi:NADH-quinone oxidoreductase subunit M
LFFVYDIIYTRTGTSDINRLGGIRAIDSKLAFLFFVIILSVVALPFTSGFVGEFLLILGLFQYHAIWAAIAAISIILGVVYMFRAFQKMMLGESNSPIKYKPLTRQELIMLFTIAGLILFLGIYPKPILSITENTVQQLLNNLPK